jgi:asparagine synthase (glutamine-hydrolysing)
MCGILGQFSFDDRPSDIPLWQSLVHLLRHRGPDDSTFWSDARYTFGHRRLSIIDLSHGQQPMGTDDGELVVNFNGEIYNYVELRAELTALGHQFHTNSDTEVLLHGYREWRLELPGKLRGMFAFAIADRSRQELFLARDPFGEKPLMYLEQRRGVAFASELKVLAALPGFSRQINEHALGAYLCLNYVPGEDTMLRGVRRIRPGTWRLWTAAGESRLGTYWRPPDGREPDLTVSLDEAIEHLEALIDESTRLALRSDVPVGLFLSGGIDSSLIARSAARSGKLAAAYCLTFAEASYSEWPAAERTARQLGIPLVDVRLEASALGDFLKLVEHADDPLADSSALAVWTLSRQVAREMKVVLSGDGGDELFAGYLTYPATLWHARVTSRLPMSTRRAIVYSGRHLPTGEAKVSNTYKLRRFMRAVDLPPSIAHFTWNGTWLPSEARAFLSPASGQAAARDALVRLTTAHRLPPHPTLRELQIADVVEYLPNDILAKSDRMSMAHGLEVRSPLLDPAIAQFALKLPERLKLGRGGVTKRVLRELASRTYGVEAARARKQGFSIPVHGWLRGPARSLVDDLLSPASIQSVPILDAAAVTNAVAAHMSGRRSYGFELWGLAVLVAWHRAFIQMRPVPEDGPQPRSVYIASCASRRM